MNKPKIKKPLKKANMNNVKPSRKDVKAKFPVKAKPSTGKSFTMTKMGDQPTRAMLGIRDRSIVKGGK